MPSKKPKIQVYVAQGELEQIIAKAQSTRLSVSEFAKRACLGRKIKSKVEAEAILALIKVNADLGRLGGLLKLWLSEPERSDKSTVRKLLRDIEDTQNILRSKIQSL